MSQPNQPIPPAIILQNVRNLAVDLGLTGEEGLKIHEDLMRKIFTVLLRDGGNPKGVISAVYDTPEERFRAFLVHDALRGCEQVGSERILGAYLRTFGAKAAEWIEDATEETK